MYSLSKLNVIIFVNIHRILFLKKHADRESLQLSFTQNFIQNDQKLKFVEENKDFRKIFKKPVTYYWKRILKKIITPECTVMMPLHVVKIFARNL